MSERAVEGIIRARPGIYGWLKRSDHEQIKLEGSRYAPARWARWGNRKGVLSVGYDTDGRVCYKELTYDPLIAPVWPELWPWWRRLLDRSVPEVPSSFCWNSPF